MNNPNLGSSQAPVVLQRQSNLPVLQPRPDLTWERGAVLNAALVWREGQYHLLYRAIDHSSAWPKDPRYRSSVGYAVSSDGLSWQTRTEPVVPIDFKPGVDAEDPRVTFLEGRYHMTYCWWDYVNGVPVPGHCVSDDLIHWKDHRILVPFDQHGFNKNAVLFPQRVRGRYVLLHRPEAAANRGRPAAEFNWRTWSRGPVERPEQKPGVTISFSDDLHNWSEGTVILLPRDGFWDDNKVGPGAPPILTAAGWLVVYHGVSKDHTYRLGLALLDANDPTRVIKRQAEPLLEPKLEWELKGDVPNVVFTCGAVLRDGRLEVVYGGADTVLGWASADISAFLKP